MVRILNAIQNLEAQPFEIQTNGCHLIKTHLKSGQKSPDFEWSGFLMVGAIAIAIAKARHLKTGLFEIQPSKTGFQMVSFQIPTALLTAANRFY